MIPTELKPAPGSPDSLEGTSRKGNAIRAFPSVPGGVCAAIRSVLALVLLLLPGLGAPPSATAQGATGAIEGLVFDSTRAEPLIGADVVLWNTSFRTRSGGGGVFRFNAVPVGTYTLNFFHPRLAELGVSAGSWTVVVTAGEETFLTVTTPSILSILLNQCVLDDPSGEHARILGRVADRERGRYVPGASVVLSWSGLPGTRAESGERRATTDANGWYRVCDAPANLPVGIMAQTASATSPRREVAVSAGGAAVVTLDVGELFPSQLSGSVRDAEGDGIIDGATIRLLGTDFSTFSAENGSFEFQDLPPGEYTLVAEHLSYASRVEGVMIGSGSSHSVEVQMTTGAIELDPLTVTVDPAGIERALAMGGKVIPAEEIDEVRQRARDLGDLMMLLRREGIMVRRDNADICVGFLVAQVQMGSGNCAPAMLYVDNTRMVDPMVAMNLPAEMVDRIILFRPVDAGALFTAGSANGVIMVFSRQGRPN